MAKMASGIPFGDYAPRTDYIDIELEQEQPQSTPTRMKLACKCIKRFISLDWFYQKKGE